MSSTTEQQPPQHQQQQQNQQTLEFYQAMADFKNMFPQMDGDVIEVVLRSNQGAVDTTIDQLLSMSTDNDNEKIRSEIEEQEDVPSGSLLGKLDYRMSQSMLKWQPPLVGSLPHSFLRISQEEKDYVDFSSALDSTLLEDERIATFLQNEEFMTELRWNEDFMNTLEKDSKLQTKMENADTDDDMFRERLKNMGKASRRKFAQLSKVFTRSKKRCRDQLLPPTASCDDLLGYEETSKQQT